MSYNKENQLAKFRQFIEENNIHVGSQMAAHMEYDNHYGYSPDWRCYALCNVKEISLDKGWLDTDFGKYTIRDPYFHLTPVKSDSIKHLSRGEFFNLNNQYSGMTPDELYPMNENTLENIAEFNEWSEYYKKENAKQEAQAKLDKNYQEQYNAIIKPLEEKLRAEKMKYFSEIFCPHCARFGLWNKESERNQKKDEKDQLYCGHTYDCSGFVARVENEKYIIRNLMDKSLVYRRGYWVDDPTDIYRARVTIYDSITQAEDSCKDYNEREYKRLHPYGHDNYLPYFEVQPITPEVEKEIAELEEKLNIKEGKE